MDFSISDKTSNLELLFIASCYRQLSADINMVNYRLKPIFFAFKGAKARIKKTCINI